MGGVHIRREGMAISDEFLDETIRFWQPYYKETLTREDAREIIETVTKVYDILARWDKKARET